jgi:hypothetical protein
VVVTDQLHDDETGSRPFQDDDDLLLGYAEIADGVDAYAGLDLAALRTVVRPMLGPDPFHLDPNAPTALENLERINRA